jgi:ribosomal protein L11 methyltransferase
MQYYKVSFFINSINSSLSEILIAELSDLNFESFEYNSSQVFAYINQNHFCENKLKKMFEEIPIFKEIKYTIELMPDKNWNEVWEKSFNPIIVSDKCVIRAPFHKQQKNKFKYEIIIEPKMSFGTGHHQTTALMIEQILLLKLKNKIVLDMGCGTGVLAFLAEKMGAEKILAIDNDEWAYSNALENKALNESLQVVVKLGNATHLIDNTFNTILANINRNILLQDMPLYVNSLKQNGYLLISGFFKIDEEVLVEKANSYGMFLESASYKDEWACLLLKK